MTIVKNGGGRFSVGVQVSAASPDPAQTTSGTASLYSTVNIKLTGTVIAGDTWSIQVTDNLGATTTYPYVAKNEDGDADVDRVDVAIGLSSAIGSTASVDPTDPEAIIITSSTGISVGFPSVNARNARGLVDTTGSTHSVVSKAIDIFGLDVTDAESWTLTIGGISKTAVVGASTLEDSSIVDTLDELGQYFAEQFASTAFTVSYSGTTLTISNPSLADFSVTISFGANPDPTVGITRSSADWKTLVADMSGGSVVTGEIWSLTLDGVTHSAIVGTTTLANGTTVVNSSNRLAMYFVEQFSSAIFIVSRSGSTLTISKTSGAPFTSSQSVVGPISASVTGIPNHWSVANIQFSGTPRAGESWHLMLVRQDGTIAEDRTIVVSDTISGAGITLSDVAKGFADAISDSSKATASGSVLTYTDSAGARV